MRSHSGDMQLAIRAAREAMDTLLQLRLARPPRGGYDPDALRVDGDREANRVITELITSTRPQDRILSEEAADDPRRHTASRLWIIDPLDGTREFGERDEEGVWRDDFAVHIALWERERGLSLGVVALPGRDLIYRSDLPLGLPQSHAGAMRIAVSRTRPPAFIAELQKAGAAQLVPMGSAGVKVMAVVTGEVDAYIHAGGQYQWDSAAPVAVALASGMIATRLDGSPLRYNASELVLPDLVVCHPDRADGVRALLDAAGFGPNGANGGPSGVGVRGEGAPESSS